jgi:hypothetical protein
MNLIKQYISTVTLHLYLCLNPHPSPTFLPPTLEQKQYSLRQLLFLQLDLSTKYLQRMKTKNKDRRQTHRQRTTEIDKRQRRKKEDKGKEIACDDCGQTA